MKPEFLYYLLGGIIISSIIFLPLRKIAKVYQLVDKPDQRKKHKNNVPVVGGIGIGISVAIVLPFLLFEGYMLHELKIVLFGAIILLVMGVIDDYLDLKSSLKLLIQVFTAHLLYFSNLKIDSLYGVFNIYELSPFFSYLFTIIIVVGVINSFNLIDGIDGLFAGYAIVSLSIMVLISIIYGFNNVSVLLLLVSGSLLSFLGYNLSSSKKIFLGDAGSLSIGFLIVGSSLYLLNNIGINEQPFKVSILIFALFSIPVFDSLRVYFERIQSGKSPFKADRTHFHHFLLSCGLNHKKASLAINASLVVLVAFSFLMSFFTEITVAVFNSLILYIILLKVTKYFKSLNHWKRRIKELETKQLFK